MLRVATEIDAAAAAISFASGACWHALAARTGVAGWADITTAAAIHRVGGGIRAGAIARDFASGACLHAPTARADIAGWADSTTGAAIVGVRIRVDAGVIAVSLASGTTHAAAALSLIEQVADGPPLS